MRRDWKKDCHGFDGWQRSHEDDLPMLQRDGMIAAYYSDVFERREAAEQELVTLQCRGQFAQLGPDNIVPLLDGWLVGIVDRPSNRR